jgi:hypothetical protein
MTTQPHNIGSSLSSIRIKNKKAPRKTKMMASFNDDQNPLKSNHGPQHGHSRIQIQQCCLLMWIGFMLFVTGGSIYKYEHPEAALAPVVPSLLIPVPVPTSEVKFVIPTDLLAWQPFGDDYYYLYSVIPGLSRNTSLKPAAKAIAAPVSPLALTPWKKNISEGTLQFLKNPTVLVEVATIVACHFLWIGPLPSLLTKLVTSRRLRVLTLARRGRIFKPFQKAWKGITTIYKNRSKLSVASEYTFYVEASSAEDEKENLESSNPTCSNNRTKKIATVHSRNATTPTTAKLPQV